MSIEDDIAFFERVPTLRLLGRTALRILAIGAENRYVHQGDTLFEAGDVADGGYVVQQGSFQVTSGGTDQSQIIAGPGTLLGELALVAETKRPATVTACEPSTVIRISRSLFLKMLEGYPDAAAKMRDQLSVRAERALLDLSNVRAKLDASESAAAALDAAKAKAAHARVAAAARIDEQDKTKAKPHPDPESDRRSGDAE